MKPDERVIELLKEGRVGVIPTDTLYGVVCVAKNIQTVERLYRVKNRDKKPGTVVAANIDQLVEIGFKARYLKAVQQFWPGPVSVVVPCVNLVYLHLGVGSIAVRISADESFNQILKNTGALLTTSANISGLSSAATIAQAHQYFGDEVDFYDDGGDLSNRQPSTVIRIVDDAVEVLRQGAYDMSKYETDTNA